MPFLQRHSDRPFPNSYWVEPGRLLAGEYPGAETPEATQARLRQLLEAGIATFIDLTRDEEVPPYAPLFAELAAAHVRHRRFPILDHSIPERPQVIVDALNEIEAALQRGDGVYVHCRAGIGRTGMVIAAYLMRQGLDNEAAFDRLQRLWQECARAKRWPVVPETDEQIDYVRRWREPGRAVVGQAARIEGAILGLVLADAIVSSVKARLIDAAVLKPTSMLTLPNVLFADSALMSAALESLIAHGQHNPEDQLQRYLAWSRSAQNDPQVTVPEAFKKALAAWQWSRKTYAGSHDPKVLDAHSVSRSLAAAVCYPSEGERTLELAADLSRTTQQSPVVLDICRVFTAYVLDALSGASHELVAGGRGPHVVALVQRLQRPEVLQVIEGTAVFRKRDVTAPAALNAALQTLESAPDFASGVQQLAGGAPTHAPALFGALMGAIRGSVDLPDAWRQSLPQQSSVLQLSRRLVR